MPTTPAQFSLHDIVSATQGRLLSGSDVSSNALYSISTDSRSIKENDFFLAIAGDRFDGHAYVSELCASKAGSVAGAIVNENTLEAHPEWQDLNNIVVVPDTVEAYLKLGQCHRKRSKAVVVALTGSSGKTTTKDMLFAAFNNQVVTQKTQKNFNNEIGVAQTLLSIQPETDLLILEMGMRGLGQIELLSDHAHPDIGLVLNIGSAHIGLTGSLENTCKAKLETVSGMDVNTSVLVYNADDSLLLSNAPAVWQGQSSAYGLSEVQDICATDQGGVAFNYEGQTIALQVPGDHMVSNAVAVLHVSKVLSACLPVTVEKTMAGLMTFLPEGGRWNKHQVDGYEDVYVINDAYNANPDSLKASLGAFLKSPLELDLKRVVIVAGMKELGEFSEDYHQSLGKWLAKEAIISHLFLVGEEARWIETGLQQASDDVQFKVETCLNVDALTQAVLKDSDLLSHSVFFLKGSRFYQLETLETELQNHVGMLG